jgi:hypothetical protein
VTLRLIIKVCFIFLIVGKVSSRIACARHTWVNVFCLCMLGGFIFGTFLGWPQRKKFYFSLIHWAMPWFTWLLVSISLWRLGFDPRSFHVGFVVDKVTLVHFYLKVLVFPLFVPFHRRFTFIHLSLTLCNFGSWQHCWMTLINLLNSFSDFGMKPHWRSSGHPPWPHHDTCLPSICCWHVWNSVWIVGTWIQKE